MKIEKLYQLFLDSTGVCTDSRKLINGQLFFALSGPTFNGNKFAEQVLNNGAEYAIIDDAKFNNHSNCILVEDSLTTLQALAQHHREQLSIPIIAITGSNGKTSTKELLHKVLCEKFNTYATKGNFNNHIGVPLSLLEIDSSSCEIAIIEMGANHVGEIAAYCKWAQPTHGLITNIGKAHLEGFGGIQGVIKGKTELYKSLTASNGIAFYNSESEILTEKVKEVVHSYAYGRNDLADYQFELKQENPSIEIKCRNQLIKSNLFGVYNAINIMAASSIGLFFEVPLEKIKQAIANYSPKNNRSEIIEKDTYKIVLDAYNANPSSMRLALETFAQREDEKKLVILGDMFELGESAEEEHLDILNLSASLHFSKTILVGHEFEKHRDKFPFLFFKETADLLNWVNHEPIDASVILIKGSRGMKLEQAVEML